MHIHANNTTLPPPKEKENTSAIITNYNRDPSVKQLVHNGLEHGETVEGSAEEMSHLVRLLPLV